jgi:hypothetical protein
MGSLSVDFIENLSQDAVVPVKDLSTQVIQFFQQEYTGGEWNPTTTYAWVPGAHTNFQPLRADTKIRFTMRLPVAWVAAGHAIGHWYFFAAGRLFWYWSESGTHIENGKTFQFEVPSWGTSQQLIGLQHRSYANDNHETRIYTTYYWNGTGRSAQLATGHLIIEEIRG